MKKFLSMFLVLFIVVGVITPAHAKVQPIKFKKNYIVGLNCSNQIKFPWDGVRYYNFKIANKKIVKLTNKATSGDYYSGEIMYQSFNGLKAGKTKVKVIAKKKVIGSFNIIVKAIKPKMSKSNYKMTFSPYGPTRKSNLLAVDKFEGEMKNYNKKAKYKLKTSNKKVANVTAGNVVACGVGKAKISVYETLNKKTRKVCTFTVESQKVKMNEVAKFNRGCYDDGLFGNGDFVEFLYLNEDEGSKNLNMYPTIKKGLLTNNGAKFEEKDYKITYVSSDPTVVTVDESGLVTAIKAGAANVEYTVTFSDGSVFSEKVNFDVE